VKAAAASAAARISADRRKSQGADHEKSGKSSFDRCTHDNLSFYYTNSAAALTKTAFVARLIRCCSLDSNY
jgi:hypothetical protein